MSEIDRLSNSGLYPALPIADKRGGKDDTPGKPPPESRPPKSPPAAAAEPNGPRPPKSIIDEYA